MLTELDIAVRWITICSALVLMVTLIFGNVRPALRLALCGLLIGSCCYLINSSDNIAKPAYVRPVVDLFSILAPFWTWLFARLLFERAVQPALMLVTASILVAGWASAHFIPDGAAVGFYIVHFLSLLLLVDLLYTAWSGRSDDLLEKRRLIRIGFPILVAIQAGSILIFELVVGTDTVFPEVQLLAAFSILLLTLFAATLLLQTDSQLLVETIGQSHEQPDLLKLSPSELVLKEKLEAAMEAKFYRTSGLSITSLASHLDVPEHRLRALINRRLGYRNFSAYLNRHRIEEAKAILADRDQVDLPILTLAMDLGYNSLPTFNRAFRELSGQTPTDFRRQVISQN